MNRTKAVFLGLVVVVALIAGGYYAYDSMKFRHETGPYTLALSRDGANWSVATPETQITSSGNELRIRTDKSKFHYQLVSNVIVVKAGSRHVIEYDVQVSEGNMFLGVLDVERDQWISQWPLSTGGPSATQRSIVVPTRAISLILSNYNVEGPRESSAVIRRIEFR